MSIRLMTQLWDNADPELSGSRLVIMLCLADHANDDGECWPSIDRLAKRSRLHRQNVMVHLKELEAAGYITVKRVEGRHNSYVVRTTSNETVTGNAIVTGNATVTTTSNETVTTTRNAIVTPPVTPALPESSSNLMNQKNEEDDYLPDLTPAQRAIRNAYDACGITYSKTHEDAHLLVIKQVGLVAWQQGWALAMEKGKHNLPAYVARCAESAMLAAQRNGNGKAGIAPVPATAEDRKRMYAYDSEEES